jgi:hypothetical protein
VFRNRWLAMVCKCHLTLLIGRPDVQASHHLIILYGALSNLTWPRRVNVQRNNCNRRARHFWWRHSGNAAAQLTPSNFYYVNEDAHTDILDVTKQRHIVASIFFCSLTCTTHK